MRLRVVALICVLSSFACQREPRVMQVEIAVGGMTCESCVEAITHEVGRLEGVRSVEVNLERGTAIVTYAEGQTEPADLEATIEEIGYDADPGDPAVVPAS